MAGPGEMKKDLYLLWRQRFCLLPHMLAEGHAATQAVESQTSGPPETAHKARADYIGDNACRSGHQSQFDSYHQTRTI